MVGSNVLAHPKLCTNARNCTLREKKSVHAFDEGNHLTNFSSVESAEAGQYIDGSDDWVCNRICCHVADSAPHKAGIQLPRMKTSIKDCHFQTAANSPNWTAKSCRPLGSWMLRCSFLKADVDGRRSILPVSMTASRDKAGIRLVCTNGCFCEDFLMRAGVLILGSVP